MALGVRGINGVVKAPRTSQTANAWALAPSNFNAL